ncbi:dihydrolipoyl dehydrogenase [Halalkalicoccus tibetensis]|uniref:Dihydrolipoyl dehydrogenase n=1 Tax=Halalkalicoccus tibetensis TaxID=175632 RepID=A0ABD5V5D1_9EURY
MQEFDLLIVGGGSGTQVGSLAAERGMSVAVCEPGPLGGACITRGCVPSKALIRRADLLRQCRDADRLGLDCEVGDVDLGAITGAVRETVYEKAENQAESLRGSDDHTLYDGKARFVDDRTVEVEGHDERVRGERVVVATGTSPTVPPVDGLEEVEFLTSDDALYLEERPDELAILGGGYIAAELGHFYAAIGSEVTIVQRGDSLVPREDPDAREAVTEAFEARERCTLHLGCEATGVEERDDRIELRAEGDGEEISIEADELLVAAGREPATEELAPGEGGVETDDAGFIEVDDELATSAEGVWALGDVVGAPLFKHAADHEAKVVAANAVMDREEAIDYSGMAHAVFTEPQVASCGQTEGELEEEGREYESARFEYGATPMGTVGKEEGFVKVLADPDGTVLGCHVAGPEAATLIHEVSVAGRVGEGTVEEVAESIHVHPAMNEAVLGAFDELADPLLSTAPDWSDVSME